MKTPFCRENHLQMDVREAFITTTFDKCFPCNGPMDSAFKVWCSQDLVKAFTSNCASKTCADRSFRSFVPKDLGKSLGFTVHQNNHLEVFWKLKKQQKQITISSLITQLFWFHRLKKAPTGMSLSRLHQHLTFSLFLLVRLGNSLFAWRHELKWKTWRHLVSRPKNQMWVLRNATDYCTKPGLTNHGYR